MLVGFSLIVIYVLGKVDGLKIFLFYVSVKPVSNCE